MIIQQVIHPPNSDISARPPRPAASQLCTIMTTLEDVVEGKDYSFPIQVSVARIRAPRSRFR